ncbi:MAG: hypothetical protein ACYTBJ_03195 [Planctomycetota bacterium]|jgi:hypothetical protein
MLSFMREQNLENAQAKKSSIASRGGAAVPPGNAQDQEYLTVASRSKNVRKTRYVIMALFGVGILGLLFMIKKSGPKSAQANENSEVETTISRLTGIRKELFERMDQIVGKFYEFSDVEQIQVRQLSKNPFMHETLWGNLKKTNQNTSIDTDLLMRQRLAQEATSLKLLSIINSAEGDYCMINEKFLHVGDSIKGFKVRRIDEDSVTLEWENGQSDNIEIELKLSE